MKQPESLADERFLALENEPSERTWKETAAFFVSLELQRVLSGGHFQKIKISDRSLVDDPELEARANFLLRTFVKMVAYELKVWKGFEATHWRIKLAFDQQHGTTVVEVE